MRPNLAYTYGLSVLLCWVGEATSWLAVVNRCPPAIPWLGYKLEKKGSTVLFTYA